MCTSTREKLLKIAASVFAAQRKSKKLRWKYFTISFGGKIEFYEIRLKREGNSMPQYPICSKKLSIFLQKPHQFKRAYQPDASHTLHFLFKRDPVQKLHKTFTPKFVTNIILLKIIVYIKLNQ